MEKTERASSGERKNDSKNTIRFQNFDVSSDYSDHHFINQNKSSKHKDHFANENKPVYKKIMKDWKVLEKHLPESIYVRVYDERIDLLRAAIVGASQTPYHDGLFFFDIVFPLNYPNEPPKVYYHSHGLRLNPNLYANGLVCLSLINTWYGGKIEKWRPDKSTILQLLVSIQGLVLNERPYWNEPGFDTPKNRQSKEGEKKSVAYSETAFILSCKTMIYNIRNPPKNFEGLVFEHFRLRRDFILGAFKAYRDGLVVVGYYRNDGSSSSSLVNVSNKFKADSEVVYRELTKALNKVAKMETVDELKANVVNPAKLVAKKETVNELETNLSNPVKLTIAGQSKGENGTVAKKGGKKGLKKKESSGLKDQSAVEKPKNGILNKIIKWLLE